jgi:hypothetical protein
MALAFHPAVLQFVPPPDDSVDVIPLNRRVGGIADCRCFDCQSFFVDRAALVPVVDYPYWWSLDEADQSARDDGVRKRSGVKLL